MHVRRVLAWVTTVMVAIVVAMAVPVSQLRTISVIQSCCCPDPADCHCPHPVAADRHHGPQQPAMGACHRSERDAVSPELPAFSAPRLALAIVPARVPIAVDHAMPAPHPAPAPARPDAPS